MFSNAYGWPVIKHLVDTHFADTYAANTADVNESNEERAKPMTENVGKHGEEVITEGHTEKIKRSDSELHEAKDHISELTDVGDQNMNSSSNRPTVSRKESAQWDDSYSISPTTKTTWATTATYDTEATSIPDTRHMREEDEKEKGTSEAEIADFLTRSPPPLEGKQEILAPAGGTASVGLGKSAAERMSTGKQRGRKMQGRGRRPRCLWMMLRRYVLAMGCSVALASIYRSVGACIWFWCIEEMFAYIYELSYTSLDFK